MDLDGGKAFVNDSIYHDIFSFNLFLKLTTQILYLKIQTNNYMSAQGKRDFLTGVGKSVFLTGASGFVASHILSLLIQVRFQLSIHVHIG